MSHLMNGNVVGGKTKVLATFQPASQAAVNAILAADDNPERGFTRSEFLWIRFSNGDLVLGVFPQDEAYFAFEEEHS